MNDVCTFLDKGFYQSHSPKTFQVVYQLAKLGVRYIFEWRAVQTGQKNSLQAAVNYRAIVFIVYEKVSAVLEDFQSFFANSRRAMPRVVPDQQRTFETKDFFRKLRNDCRVIYVGSKDKQSSDSLLEDCKNQELHINFVGRGTTLTLPFKNSVTGKGHGLSSDFVEVDHDEKIVRMVKPFILNGVCVIFKGWLSIETLDGIGHLEFDPEAAKEQERLLYNPSSGPVGATYLSETTEANRMEPLSVYQIPLLSFPPISHGIPIPAILSQPLQPDTTFLTPSVSPSESMEMPFKMHWKKNNRRNSESSRESQRPPVFLAVPSPNVPSENEVLDLSKSSKTYPPKILSSSPSSSSSSSSPFEYRGVPSLDETVNSFNNCCNIRNSRDPPRGTLRLTPKKKYSNWDFRKPTENSSTTSEKLKDSSTQTLGYDFSFPVDDPPGSMFSSSTPVHGNNPGVVGEIKEEMLENKENNCKRSLPSGEKN